MPRRTAFIKPKAESLTGAAIIYEILITIDQAHISRVTDKTLNTVMLPPDWFYQEI